MSALSRDEQHDALMSGGELTGDQFKRLVVYEAGFLGLEFDKAVELARKNELPKNALGASVQSMIMNLMNWV